VKGVAPYFVGYLNFFKSYFPLLEEFPISLSLGGEESSLIALTSLLLVFSAQ